MASTKNYGILAKFQYEMDRLAFMELYHTVSFLYETQETRNKNMIAIAKRCKKKCISVELKNIVRKGSEAEEKLK